jgi:hypothetical protein
MTTILIVDKLGNIKELTVKSFSEGELYKKAGFKNAYGFKLQAMWDVSVNDKFFSVRLFGKTAGRGTQENKYEFPPPVDSLLLFGNCVLVNVINDIAVDVSKDEWTSIYEGLYGGFINTGDSDESESDEGSEIGERDIVLTKDGYEKNAFIVDDNHNSSDDSSDESSQVVPIKKSSFKRKPADKSKPSRIPEPALVGDDVNNNNYMDCSMELDEDMYD